MHNSPLHSQAHTVYQDCPCCGYKKAVSITVRDGRVLYHCHVGCSQSDLAAVMAGHDNSPPRNAYHYRPSNSEADRTALAQELWDNAKDGRKGLVPTYLASRGLVGPMPPSLRFLPSHLHRQTQTTWPVMLAAATGIHGKLHGVHRTYLALDGRAKAPVMSPKMTLGLVGGFACHLAPAAPVMAVSEGIETGLSVQLSTGLPTWAALSSGGIRKLILPPLPLAAEVIIAADNDSNGCGQHAAAEAASRWTKEGRRVRIALPPKDSDFNDVLQKQTSAFADAPLVTTL